MNKQDYEGMLIVVKALEFYLANNSFEDAERDYVEEVHENFKVGLELYKAARSALLEKQQD